jgi:hypothetical protein
MMPAESIKRINASEYLAICVTNQPVVARGETTFEELQNIHNKMEDLLGQEGAYLNDLFFCPHHPDAGFPAKCKELKIVCDCRKPKIGLIEASSGTLQHRFRFVLDDWRHQTRCPNGHQRRLPNRFAHLRRSELRQKILRSPADFHREESPRSGFHDSRNEIR